MTARYDLSSLELEEERRRFLARVASEAGDEPVVVAWVHPEASAANVIRTLEAEIFSGISAFMSDEVEQRSRFIGVVDLSGDEPELVHAFRVTSVRFGPESPVNGEAIGIPMADEVVEANDGVSTTDVLTHYRHRGIDLWRCVAVETNFRLVKSMAPSGLRWSDVGYIRVFQELMRGEDTFDDRGVFAHLNEEARRSLGAIGIMPEAFAGRPELRSPAAHAGTHDDRYTPAFLHATASHVEVFRQLEPLAAPEVVIGSDR